MPLPPEFSRIARHFRPLAGPGSLNLTDDAAVFAPPPGRELVMTADAMVESVHFLPGTAPGLVARKLLRVNLSDLAAMGATPFGYLITISVPRALGEDWFTGFAAGLQQDQAEFAIALLGGDTTETPGRPHAFPHRHRPCRTRRSHPALRRQTRRRALGHRYDRRRRARPLRRPWRAARSGWLLEIPLRSSDTTARDSDHPLGARGDGRVGWVVPGPRPYMPRERAWARRLRRRAFRSRRKAEAAGLAWREKAWIGGDDYELLLAVPPGAPNARRRQSHPHRPLRARRRRDSAGSRRHPSAT